ncbi:MAG: hypothetical protein EZS28_025966 [Streblomastix strix]|uniref:Uncharacterized protein n=1 Tax=Streblomastix strix TaxID=222440 RepID=A0A5J4V7P3_9EUKA|nr:MAG: hypothetical protein EZS28_025966 [Streblomastix strix]
MMRRTNYTSKRQPNRNSNQTQNYTNSVPQNPPQTAAHLQPTFVNAFHQNIVIDLFDTDQTIAVPQQVPPNTIIDARRSQPDFWGKKLRRSFFTRINRQKSQSQKLNNAQGQPQTQQRVEERQSTIIYLRNRCLLLIRTQQIWKRNCNNCTDCNWDN